MNEQQPTQEQIVQRGHPNATRRHRRQHFTIARNTDFLFGVSRTKSAIRLHLPFVAFTFYRKDYHQ